MPLSISFNGREDSIPSVEALSRTLERFDKVAQFELWATIPNGPSLCMLRNRANAWLMYLRQDGDSGFNSVGDTQRNGTEWYILSNGQKDDYPLAWCIEVEQCYEAILYFHANEGARPASIQWQAS